MGRALLVEINRYNEGNLDQEAQIALAKQYAIFAKNWLTDPANAVYIQNVIQLDCSGCNLKILPKELQFFTGLQNLDLSHNKLTEINGLNALGLLQRLNLKDNQLTDVNGLNALGLLQRLFLSHNQLTDVNGFNALGQLQWLDLSHNLLTDINGLDALGQLQCLFLSHNQTHKYKRS